MPGAKNKATTAGRKGARRAAGTTSSTGISSEAVRKATGRTWDQWLALLDKAGAKAWTHAEIARHLSTRCGVGDWWSQMVAVGYEQARGLRAKHQKGDRYEISASKTIAVAVGDLFEAWADERRRAAWLPDPIEVRKATRPRSMRVTWAPTADKTSVSVNFYAKGAGKSSVSLNHGKLKSAAAGERMKKQWSGRLAALKALLEA